jgi:N-acetylglucosaminyldiphosphoundecaprenol N-acetyl-beta-D-mannosaminyltransferase
MASDASEQPTAARGDQQSLRVTSADGQHTVDFGRDVHTLLGLPFDAVTLDAAVERVRQAAQQRRPLFLTTPNINFVIAAQKDSAFRDSVIHSDLSVTDGMPLVWLSRWLGLPLNERVAGSDLFERLRSDHRPALKVYFFGGPEGVAQKASDALGAARTGLCGVGGETPGFGSLQEMSRPSALERINRCGADFLVVALGAKKGQAWLEHNRASLTVPVVSHLGAVVNFVAGTVVRAPPLWRRFGLEWLWRIRSEPALWRRYAGDAVGLLKLLFKVTVHRKKGTTNHAQGVTCMVTTANDLIGGGASLHLAFSSSGGQSDLNVIRSQLAAAVHHDGEVVLQFADQVTLTGSLVALLQLFEAHRRRQNLLTRFVASNFARSQFKFFLVDYLLLAGPERYEDLHSGFQIRSRQNGH